MAKMEPTKKQRLSGSKTWMDVSDLIRTEGGFISNSLEFCDSSRSVKNILHIQKNSLLMRIPQKLLLTLKRVESSSIGPFLFKTVDAVDESKLFNEKNDLVIALFLAFLSICGEKKDTEKEYSDVFKYLATLPENNSYNNLPRRWSNRELQNLLGGTCAIKRALDEKQGLESDYKILKETYFKVVTPNLSTCPPIFHYFPSIEGLDQMLAAVGSRAFESLGHDGLDAMIPLLDLLNHKRGVGETSDVSYKKGEDGSIYVTSKCDLDAGSFPGITYGAKGNSLLLIRYGFTLKENLEPDGSSNDVTDLSINGVLCSLRTGPKSYTFGPFVKAIECLQHEDTGNSANDGLRQGEDDGPESIEDFLNSCQEEDGFDLYGDTGSGDEEESGEGAIESDCQAIESFKYVLEKTAKNFYLKDSRLKEALERGPSSNPRFCAYLVKSELRTIRFYTQAAALILDKLRGITSEINAPQDNSDTDSKLLRKQALELRDAFCRIRYPDL